LVTIIENNSLNMKYLYTALILLFSFNLTCFSQNNAAKSDSILSNEPIFFLDENRVKSDTLSSINPTDIAAVVVYKDTSALRILGNEGKNGVIYITTIEHARTKYIAYFKSKSTEYADIVRTIDDELNVVYILNNKILEKANAGDLYLIDDTNYIDLKVINESELQKGYNIPDKKFGIIINTKQKDKL